MTKKTTGKRVAKDDAEQSKRFVETAKKLGQKVDSEAFEKVVQTITPRPKDHLP